MKSALFYYYQLSPLKLIKKKNYYYFFYEDALYYLCLLDRPIDYINEIILLDKMLINSNYMNIIYNIKGEAISLINNRYYMLLRSNNIKFSLLELYRPYYCYGNMLKLKILNHSDWGSLWTVKIDYFEYQKSYIKIKYPILYSSLDYYIGLSENAISYFYATNSYLKKDNADVLVVARRRINLDDFSFYNPLNLVIDHKARDVAEYLKYLFIKDNYSYDLIDEILDNINFSSYQFSLLMARLLFPSFYFDLYEDIINGYSKEERIVSILKRSSEYENYIRYIYFFINKKRSILKIDWLDSFI